MDKENYSEYNAVLGAKELRKPKRLEKFISYLKNDGQFIVKVSSNERLPVFLRKKNVLDTLQEYFDEGDTPKISEKINKLQFEVINKNNNKSFTVNLKQIVKDKNFGGKDPTRVERGQIKELQDQINKIKNEKNLKCISLDLGNDIYDVFDVKKAKNGVKADIVFLDINGDPIAWGSLKKENFPKDFQQWSGISSRASDDISKHNETQAFIDYVKINFKEGIKTPIMKTINDINIKKLAVFGSKALSSKNNEENVNIVIQSNKPSIKQSGNHYVIDAKIFTKKSMPKNEYEPTFYGRPDNSRNDQGIPKTRLGIFPKDYKPEGKVEEIKYIK